MDAFQVQDLKAFLCGVAIGGIHWIVWYLSTNNFFQSLIDKELKNLWGKKNSAPLRMQFFLPWLIVIGGVYGALKFLSFPVRPVCLGIVAAVFVGLVAVVCIVVRQKRDSLHRVKEEE
ncbi:MAG: hypothetical protein ACI38Q_01570 [Candidatus Bruticola sp.]